MHKQIDTGLGFECDEGVVELVRLFNKIPGILTEYSCQGDRDHEFVWKGVRYLYTPAYVLFSGELGILMKFCMRLRHLIYDGISSNPEDWRTGHDQLTLWFQSDAVRGVLDFDPRRMGAIISIVQKVLDRWDDESVPVQLGHASPNNSYD